MVWSACAAARIVWGPKDDVSRGNRNHGDAPDRSGDRRAAGCRHRLPRRRASASARAATCNVPTMPDTEVRTVVEFSSSRSAIAEVAYPCARSASMAASRRGRPAARTRLVPRRSAGVRTKCLPSRGWLTWASTSQWSRYRERYSVVSLLVNNGSTALARQSSRNATTAWYFACGISL